MRQKENRLENLIKTPYGYGSMIRARKDVRNLAKGRGHSKQILQLAKSIIIPTMATKVQICNVATNQEDVFVVAKKLITTLPCANHQN